MNWFSPSKIFSCVVIVSLTPILGFAEEPKEISVKQKCEGLTGMDYQNCVRSATGGKDCAAAKKEWLRARGAMGDACAKVGLSRDSRQCMKTVKSCDDMVAKKARRQDDDTDDFNYSKCPHLAARGLDDLSDKLDKKEKALDDLKSKIDDRRSKHRDDQANLDEKIQTATQELTELNQKIQGLAEEKQDELDKQLKDIQRQIDANNSQLTSLRRQVEATSDKQNIAISQVGDACFEEARKMQKEMETEQNRRRSVGHARTGSFSSVLGKYNGNSTSARLEAWYKDCMARKDTQLRALLKELELNLKLATDSASSLIASTNSLQNDIQSAKQKADSNFKKEYLALAAKIDGKQRQLASLYQQKTEEQKTYDQRMFGTSDEGQSPICQIAGSKSMNEALKSNCRNEVNDKQEEINKLHAEYEARSKVTKGLKVSTDDVAAVQSKAGDLMGAAEEAATSCADDPKIKAMQADAEIDSPAENTRSWRGGGNDGFRN